MHRVVVANDADELGEALIPTGGVAGNRSVEASMPALPDIASRVDQEVVGNVIPALLGAGVKVIEGAENSRSVGRSVTIPRRRMMHDQEPDFLRRQRSFGWAIDRPGRAGMDAQRRSWSHRQEQCRGRSASHRQHELTPCETVLMA